MRTKGIFRTLVLIAFAALGSAEARGQIRITEYMYSGANGEFVELTNISATAVDMTGWSYDDDSRAPGALSLSAFGVVAAGESVIITDATTAAAFRTAWNLGAGVKIIGGSTQGLARGDEINIYDSSNALIDRLSFNDQGNAGWDPPIPAGSIRTQNKSGWGCAQGLGTNNILKWYLSAVADQQGSFTSTGGDIGSPGTFVSITCPNAPVVASTIPLKKGSVATLPSVTVTFSASVTGVVAGNMTVNGSAATSVSGSGAGPYVFSGYSAPAAGSVSIALASGAIVSQFGAVAFAGDSWTVSVGVSIVINELNYHPSETLYPGQETEFVELYNAGAANIDLGSWSFSGITHVIPNGTIINAGGYKVLAVNSAALQTATGYAGAIQWTSGALANSGENISIRDGSLNVIDSVTFSDSGEWPTAADGNGPSLELVNPAFPNEFGGAWRASIPTNGTPGAQNSTYQATLAPIITSTKHTPIIPAANQTVTVTATVVDDSPSPTVTLYFRQDQDPTISYSSTPMLDDGAHADGAAGDKVYGATVPGLADGQRLDFTIRADDGTNVSAAPTGNNTLTAGQNPNQTYLCKFSNAALPTDFPSFHLITTQRIRNLQEDHIETEFDATFVHCDTSGNCVNWYNATEHYRGSGSLGQHPHSYRIDIPDSPVFDSELGFPTTKLNLLSQSVFKQYLGMQFFREAFGGQIATPKSQFIRLNTSPLSHGGVQDFVYHFVEVLGDGDFLESQDGAISPRRFPDLCSASLTQCTSAANCGGGESCLPTDDGNLYRGRHDGARLNYKGPNKDSYRTDVNGTNGYQKYTNETEDNWDDLIALCFALDPTTTPDAAYEASVSALIDEDEWAKWFAIHMLLNNEEGGIYRDTGDDFFIYFSRVTSPGGYNAKLLPWDMDSTFGGFIDTYDQETIWRTTTVCPQRFVRSNVYAGRFVKAICDMLSNEFTQANLYPKIDALPTPVADANRKQTLKNWVAARRTFVQNEIKTQLTIANLPASPYTNANPVVNLNGQLNQCGTRYVKINGVNADAYSVYAATWSKNYTLQPGLNHITVQCFDYTNVEISRVDSTVLYDPAPATPGLRLVVPTRMVDNKTLTLRADILDASGSIEWRTCNQLGTVSATRVSDGSAVPLTVTVFERHNAGAGSGGPPTTSSIRFYNGVGCVSLMLNNGAAVPPGDILVTVTVGSLTASKIVEVVDGDVPALFKNLSGSLSGANLTWSPSDGVIHLTGNVSVPSGQTLTIQPGTLIMVDPGPDGAGTKIVSNSSGILAQGTRLAPVYFFPTTGAAAMVLPQTGSEGSGNGHNNPSCWGGFELTGSGSMTWSYVFMTGTGNDVVSGHPRPTVIRLADSHAFTATDSVLADSPGKIIYGNGGGVYTFQRCLFARNGIGGEFIGVGYTLTMEDTWMTRIGRAPVNEANRLDGDILHIDQPSNSHLRRCILTDGGDDVIDHSSAATPVVENTIIYDANDKVVSIGGGGSITMTNCLIFNVPNGIRCAGVPAILTNCTLGSNTNVNGQACTSVIQKCILWTNSADTCCGTVNHTIVGNAGHLGCGTGNLSTNPLFFSTSCNYSLQGGSPALTAGPGGTQIGWLGFPFPTGGCVNNIDCNDGNPCTTDTCSNGACNYSAVPGCCLTNVECDDGSACTTDTCSNNVCTHTAISCNDNNACTTDSCNPLTGCFQTPVNCDDSNLCTVDSCDPQLGCQNAGVSCPQGQACNPANGQCQAAPVTATFQDGVASYTGTQDTYLDQAAPSTVRGAVDTWRWDTEDPAPSQEYGLIRFDSIFGGGPGQIPPGSQISSATLTLVVFNGGATPQGTVNEVLVDWAEATATWNNFGGEAGAQTDEYNTTKVADAPIATGTVNITVTSSLQTWLTNPIANRGWIFVPLNNDGVQVRSREYATVAERPKLTVIYTPPVTSCTTDAECSDGLFCNGVETCNQTTHSCQPGTAPNCNDNIACTSDSCNEATDSCDHVPNNGACSDGNPCTDDLCVVGTGCTNPPNTATCDDGNACTTNDTCSGGNCVSGPAANCDDGIACTTDACNPTTGCTHTDNCTGGQTCNHTTGLCSTGPVTTTFQQNVSGYTGTADTYIDAALGSQAGVTPIVIDGTPVEQVLIRFDGIFGSGPSQIPTGSTIVSATLTLRVGGSANDESANAVNFHRLLHAWNVTDVWAAYGVSPWNAQGGIQADSVDAAAAAEATATMSSVSTAYPVNVTGSVQAWAANPTSNYGWAILPSGADGLRLESAESTTAAFRPLLSVTYTPPSTGCNSDAECSDGLYCNGVETCNQTTHLCESGTAPDCNDNIACTADSCNEATDSCDHVPNNGACSDGLPCTDDACVVGTGCTHTPNPAACDDSNLCTDDACDAGVCVHTAHDCNDNNACTTDTCDPGLGCQHAAINCDDGISCTVDSCNPVLGCEHVNNCNPSVEAVGPRYLRVTPPAGLASVALRVESASIPCLPKYVDATGHLIDTPFFQSSTAWGAINVGDRQIIPGTFYDVRADVRAPNDAENLSSPATVATWQWGNVDNTGDVSIFDIVCVLDGFQNVYNACSLYGDDLQLAVPDRLIDMWDIMAVIDAFQGLPYPDTTPCGSLLAIRAASASGQQPQVTLVPRQTGIAPGASVAVDVFISQMAGLRAYQLAAQIGGGTGPLLLDGAVLDANRTDYAFAQMNAQSAIDVPNRRLANVLFTGSSDCSSRKYLATFTVRTTASSRGQFTVSLANGGQTVFVDQNGQAVEVVVNGATISVITRLPGSGPLQPADPKNITPFGG